MNKIHILPPHEAQKIAAGEIVERPSSVVKELLENALDAGATDITLALKEGGKSLIRVTDNGCGMHESDARASIQKHATSKITCMDDVHTIQTFGFRGEALAALAAVSRMTIFTKEEQALNGINLTIENGTIVMANPCSAKTGTTIEIADLFYNVPARQKFLKKRETEFRHIQQLFQALCLAHPHIHARFYSEDTLIAQYSPTSIYIDRSIQVLQAALHQTMLPITHEGEGVKIYGAISDHQWYTYDRSHIFLFVNKRWIKNQSLMRAVMRGYTNVLPNNRFPSVSIMIEVPTHEVDINVHPRKEEVQFVHPHRIETALVSAIKQALTTKITTHIPKTSSYVYTNPINTSKAFFDTSIAPLHTATLVDEQTMYTQSIASEPIMYKDATLTPSISNGDQQYQSSYSLSMIQNSIQNSADSKIYTIVGQLQNTYILIQHEQGLMIIDQHAAHECILYEQCMQNTITDSATIQLLFPELITMTPHDITTLMCYTSLLQEKGIVIEQFGNTQIRVIATPVYLKNTRIEEIIRFMISNIHENAKLDIQECHTMINKKLCAQMACKAAVKAGDILDQQQMDTLVKKLYATQNRLTCPHGRPTHWLITQYEIEKKFKRVS